MAIKGPTRQSVFQNVVVVLKCAKVFNAKFSEMVVNSNTHQICLHRIYVSMLFPPVFLCVCACPYVMFDFASPIVVHIPTMFAENVNGNS